MKFKPTWWSTLFLLIFSPLFIHLGMWQLDRGGQKHTLQESYLQQTQLPAVRINTLSPSDFSSIDLNLRQGEATGHFLNHIHVLLDNQIYKGEVGYTVLTPFQIESTEYIIWVNRGWTSIVNRDRNAVPEVSAETTPQSIKGIFLQPPKPAFQLSDQLIESMNPQIWRVQVFDIQYLTQKIGIQTLPYVLKLASDEPSRFVQDWQMPVTDEQKHYAYALQWFSFATIAFIIYLVAAIRRGRSKDVKL